METQPAHFSYCLTSTSPSGPRSNTQKQGCAVTSVPASVVFGFFFFKGKEQGGRPITSKENHWLPTSIPYCCQWACRNRRWGEAKQFDCSHMAPGKLSFTFLLQSYSVLFQKEKKKEIYIYVCMYTYGGEKNRVEVLHYSWEMSDKPCHSSQVWWREEEALLPIPPIPMPTHEPAISPATDMPFGSAFSCEM